MPWPRLCALGSIRDLSWLAARHPKIRQCFNLSPSLLDQILRWKEDSRYCDDFYHLSEIPAHDLDETQTRALLRSFFMADWNTMIPSYPRYEELLRRRGSHVSDLELSDAIRRYTVQDLRDLQVWHNLAWTGYSLREDRPWVAELISKGKDFTEEEKTALLQLHKEHVTDFIVQLTALSQADIVELTTCPYYHPILPLLCHMEKACQPHPRLALPQNPYQYPEDATLQLRKAKQRHEEIFRTTPLGLWPPEAAISEESIEVVAAEGFQWLATDEEILVRSLTSGPEAQYWPYLFERSGDSIAVVCRDKRLSDFIEFDSPQIPSDQASGEILRGIEKVRLEHGNKAVPPLITIVLNGDKPWERSPDSGKSFLDSLFNLLAHRPYLKSCTVKEYLLHFRPDRTLKKIYPGSWSQHGFDSWVGERDKCLAWDYLVRARNALCSVEDGCSGGELDLSLAKDSLLAAQGSDWFQSLGYDTHSEYDETLDFIFRAHLGRVYEGIGLPLPTYLRLPISSRGSCPPVRPGKGFMKPVLDGYESEPLEWTQAACFDLAREAGKHWTGTSIAKHLYCGHDMEYLWIRLDFDDKNEVRSDWKNPCIRFRFIRPIEAMATIPLSLRSARETDQNLILPSSSGEWTGPGQIYLAFREILELGVSFADLGISQGEELRFIMDFVVQGDCLLERWPTRGFFSMKTPVKDYERRLVKI